MEILSEKLVEDFFRPFTASQITTLVALAVVMEKFSVTSADVIAMGDQYFQRLKESMGQNAVYPAPPEVRAKRAKVKGRRPTTICPLCGGAATIEPVNVSKCTQVGGDWHTSLVCSNTNCHFTELSIKTVAQWRENNGS